MVAVTRGRDLSHHNVVHDYDAARADLDWVQTKVSEGTDFVDDASATVVNGRAVGPGPHYRGFAGRPRGPYHFARPVSVRDQVAHFLAVKAAIGTWERRDMLDCEFPGVTGAFIRDLKDEYRAQSGISRVYVYVGVDDLRGPCDPDLFWDEDVDLWVPRYRKKGPPDPADWGSYLGFWHPGIRLVQWDDALPLAGAGLTDVSDEVADDDHYESTEDDVSDRIPLTPATDPLRPGRGVCALPGPAADSVPGKAGTECRVSTGWGQKFSLVVWYLADGGAYLGPKGGAGHPFTVLSDVPGKFPVPDGTVAIHVQWTSAKADVPGDLAIKFVPLP